MRDGFNPLGAVVALALAGGASVATPGPRPRRRVSAYAPHNGAREAARRVRQAERDRANRSARLPAAADIPLDGSFWGLSRRGRLVRL